MAESLLSCLVPRMLGRFTKKAPRVRLELHCANCHDIRNGVLSGEYDMGLYYDVGGHTSSLSLERLGRAEGVLVSAPSMPDSLRDFTSFHQEKDVAFIINEPRSVFRERMEAYLRVRDIRLSSTVEIWNIESIRRCVAEGMGVSFLPRFTGVYALIIGMAASAILSAALNLRLIAKKSKEKVRFWKHTLISTATILPASLFGILTLNMLSAFLPIAAATVLCAFMLLAAHALFLFALGLARPRWIKVLVRKS